jgi:hypothetical protein
VVLTRNPVNANVKVKVADIVVPVHVMKAHRRSRGLDPLILNLDTRWR